ncbi:MAG: hypothetical protein PHE53_08785 [Thermoguttaceae bacterium]|nr:hypothetical protein [Thermoguttaceae bacterium]
MPSTSGLLVDPVEVAAARSIVQKCWELRSVAIRVILVVGWFLGCMGLTAGIEVIFHDFVVSSPLVLNQMFLEIVHLPKVVAWFFYGFSGIFLLAAWWKAFRMSLVAAILAFSIYNLFYGFGTLCFGAALGFRPNDRTLYLLFAVSMATPGWLRLCGMRRIAIFGLILVLILGIVSAFRSEVFSLYNMGTVLLADVTVLFPWCVGWTFFEIGYGIFSLVRRFRLKGEDENFDFE